MSLVKDLFIRNLELDDYLENFFISAVVSVFAIRIFLLLTHYPQLGAGVYHIAHIVWGGVFMLIALVLMFSFMGQKTVSVASVLGGIGFGAFIDELGKFISSNNDYFFEPAIAFIYMAFVLIYILSRVIPAYRKTSQREYLVNAIEMLKESAINDFDKEEERRAVEYLEHCDPDNPTVKALKRLMSHLEVVPAQRPGFLMRFRMLFRKNYYAIAQSGKVVNIVLVFLTIQMVSAFIRPLFIYVNHPQLTFSEWGQLFFSMFAGFIVLLGLNALRRSRVESYRYFRIAVLISILLTDFFALMIPEWTDGLILAANVFTLLVITYAMRRDQLEGKSSLHAQQPLLAKNDNL